MNTSTQKVRVKDSELKKGKIEEIKKEGEKFYPLLEEIAKKLYQLREVSLKEKHSSRYLMEILEKHGFRVHIPPVKGLSTHFVAEKVLSDDGPAIAFIAEYDALPEIGHGCGHNLIAAASVTAGIILSHTGYRGKVMVIGTPAEETGRGKISMIEAGIFNDLDYALMFHPGNRTRMRPELVALSEVNVRYTGKEAHASSYPDRGINALHALINLFNLINSHRQNLSNDFRINGIITRGGVAPNIIPAEAEATFHLRAKDSMLLQELKKRFKKMAKAAAEGSFTKVKISFSPFELKEMKHYPFLEDLFRENLLKLSPDIDLDETPRGRWASSDIGNLSHIIPTLQATIRITEKPTPIHTKEFAEATLKEFALRRTLIAAETLALTGVSLQEKG